MTLEPLISAREAKFVPVLVNGLYHVQMPEFVRDRGADWTKWEVQRFASMRERLQKGDILFDIGAETGEISAIYAQFVGAENMVLCESNPVNWQNIRATWNANYLLPPKRCFAGLIGENISLLQPGYTDFEVGYVNSGWPICAMTDKVWTMRSYRYLHEHAKTTPIVSIDSLSNGWNVIPKAITIDTEGAEFPVLLGAENVLRKHRPLVWASLHEGCVSPELLRSSNAEVDAFMDRMGYNLHVLGTDHEKHMLYTPR